MLFRDRLIVTCAAMVVAGLYGPRDLSACMLGEADKLGGGTARQNSWVATTKWPTG